MSGPLFGLSLSSGCASESPPPIADRNRRSTVTAPPFACPHSPVAPAPPLAIRLWTVPPPHGTLRPP